MIIRSKNFVLKLEEILKDSLPTERYNVHENFVLNIIRRWHSREQFFIHQTSGSTGRPKKIKISRDKIEISTEATLSFIDAKRQIKKSLLCLDPKHIGGAMVVYRSMIANHDLTLVTPESNPMEELAPDESFDLVSMVPMQFNRLNESQLNRFGTILIGGAPMEVKKIETKAKIYSAFGMTETVSHIALRLLDETLFKTTGDTEVALNTDNSLKIKGAITDYKWLDTNDLAKVLSSKSFEWIGRKDFIINSGGIKINPEEIELLIGKQSTDDIMISSLPDDVLGQKVILISNGKEQEFDFSKLQKYHKPKECYFNQRIHKTSSGKLDRIKTLKQFEETL